MEIPIYINQEKVGQLRIMRDGLYTVFEAEAKGSSGLVRLWTHGSGKSAYLGVMQTWSGGLWLRRKLSALELKSFPDPIEFVSDREAACQFTEIDLHNNFSESESTISDEQYGLHNCNDKTDNSEKIQENICLHNNFEGLEQMCEQPSQEDLHNAETNLHACPWPAEPPEDGLLWYSRPDGSLVAFDGISSLIALPAEPGARLPRAAERVIEGQKYLVFRY